MSTTDANITMDTRLIDLLHAIAAAGGIANHKELRDKLGEDFNDAIRHAVLADLVITYSTYCNGEPWLTCELAEAAKVLLPAVDRYDIMPVAIYRALDARDREAARGRAYNNVDKAKAQAARLAAAEAAITIHEEFAAATKVVFDVNTDYDGTTVRIRRIENRDGELLWTDTAGTIGGHPDDDGEWDADSIAGDLLTRAHEFDSTVFDHIGTSLHPSRYDFDFEPRT